MSACGWDLKILGFCSEGQNFLKIFIALVAEGVNLVMKANIFFLAVKHLFVSDRCQLLDRTQLV